RYIGQMHPLYVNNSARRIQFQEFTSEIKSAPFAIRPFIADLPTRSGVVDAYGHSPALGPEHPLLDDFRVRVGAVHRFWWRREAPGHNDKAIAFGLQGHFAHRGSFPFFGFISSRTLSSLS